MKEITVTSVLNRKKKRDALFLDDYTINPYSGCSFNCIYCYVKGSKYGFHQENKASLKWNAIELLKKQLQLGARKKQFGFIVLSSSTDPYVQFEEEESITRDILLLILEHRFPVHIITKSPMVIRDFDVLNEINRNAVLPDDLQNRLEHKVLITFSFSTIDKEVASIFEPGAPSPEERLTGLMNAHEAGFKTGVSMMPLIPYITDTDDSLQRMLHAFKNSGSHYVLPSSLTLSGYGSSHNFALVKRAIAKYYPELISKYDLLYGTTGQLPAYYQSALMHRVIPMAAEMGLSTSIIA